LGLEGAADYCQRNPEISALLVTSGQVAGGIDLHPLNLAENRWRRL
jgi:hypothetical protein